MITLALVALLATLVVSWLYNLISSNSIKSTAESLYGNIELLRSEAVKSNKNLTLVWKTGTNWCYGMTDKATCDCSKANDCTIDTAETVTKPAGTLIALTATGFPANQVQFDGVRGIASSSGTLIFSRNEYSASIAVSKLGRLSLCGANLGGGYATC